MAVAHVLGSDERGHIWAMRFSGHIDSLQGGPRLPSQIGSAAPGIMTWSRGPGGRIWLIENARAARLEDGGVHLLAEVAERFERVGGVGHALNISARRAMRIMSVSGLACK